MFRLLFWRGREGRYISEIGAKCNFKFIKKANFTLFFSGKNEQNIKRIVTVRYFSLKNNSEIFEMS